MVRRRDGPRLTARESAVPKTGPDYEGIRDARKTQTAAREPGARTARPLRGAVGPASALAVDFYLPWTQGSTFTCTQGNGGSASHLDTYNRYAWDFGLGFGEPVRASAAGTVIGLRRTAADYVANPNINTPVNYVLILHSDGTRTGYYHLKYDSLPANIQLNSAVRKGQVIGAAGASGYSFGAHLHFSRYNAAGASVPLSFAEAGVPVDGGRYTSGNAEDGGTIRYNPVAPGDAGFTKGGAAAGWTSFGGGVYGTAIYTYVSPSVRDNWGRWSFDLSKLSGTGNYRIEAYITPTNAGTKNAIYHINTSGGRIEKKVDQFNTTGWTDLGTYALSNGSSWVELDDVTGEVNQFNESSRIAFDAVRLTFVSPPPPPPPPPATPKTVYRFRNLRNGFYLWTADENEKNNIVADAPRHLAVEGPAYKINTANTANSSPLWRFVNIRGGYYLYTANPAEKASIIANLGSTWRYEGPAYNVSTNTSGSPVWRFRNKQNGTYLYSADLNEKNSIVAKLAATWQLRGRRTTWRRRGAWDKTSGKGIHRLGHGAQRRCPIKCQEGDVGCHDEVDSFRIAFRQGATMIWPVYARRARLTLEVFAIAVAVSIGLSAGQAHAAQVYVSGRRQRHGGQRYHQQAIRDRTTCDRRRGVW